MDWLLRLSPVNARQEEQRDITGGKEISTPLMMHDGTAAYAIGCGASLSMELEAIRLLRGAVPHVCPICKFDDLEGG